VSTNSTTRASADFFKTMFKKNPVPPLAGRDKLRAEDRARTGHPNLGKVVLYQMSYFRILYKNLFEDSKNNILHFTTKFLFCEIYLYFGVYNVLSGTSTSGLPL
jgi:hypothetical protein